MPRRFGFSLSSAALHATASKLPLLPLSPASFGELPDVHRQIPGAVASTRTAYSRPPFQKP
jgi:hypothetical protein